MCKNIVHFNKNIVLLDKIFVFNAYFFWLTDNYIDGIVCRQSTAVFIEVIRLVENSTFITSGVSYSNIKYNLCFADIDLRAVYLWASDIDFNSVELSTTNSWVVFEQCWYLHCAPYTHVNS